MAYIGLQIQVFKLCFIIFFFFVNYCQNQTDAIPLSVSKENASIEFRNVNFGYQDGKPILNNLSFVIPPGKKVAIVGGSGSG